MKSLSVLGKGRFRIEMDECWKFETPENKKELKPWMERIPCAGGAFISYFSEKPVILQLWSPRLKNLMNIYRTLQGEKGVTMEPMEREGILFFPPQHLATVADLCGARKKRQVSEAQKEHLRKIGKKHQFEKGNIPLIKNKNSGVQTSMRPQQPTIVPKGR